MAVKKVLKLSVIAVGFFAFLASFAFLQCSNKPVEPDEPDEPRELTGTEKTLAESSNKFAFKLFREINSEENDKSLFISPLSVSYALGMAYNGAAGDTREAIQSTLELSGLTLEEVNSSYKSLTEFLTGLDPEVAFLIANSIWYRLGFEVKDEFINLNKTYFAAEVAGLDFNDPEAAGTINAWVSENTRDKIDKIVESPIDPYTMLFLINAVYFKGTWTYEFDKELTTDAPFFLIDGSTAPCRMMHQKSEFSYFANDDVQMITLPYGSERFSMAILLPAQEININDFAADLDEESWNSWLGSLSEHEVNLSMPKFKLEYEMSLNSVLATLGMEIAFAPFQADFTNINETPGLYISKVKHKSFVEVNEEGTEAAAVTSIEIGIVSVPPNEIFMRINRPFLFVIYENQANTILFMGKILQPTL